METVTLDGVEYLKASVAAKRFRYTPDYIGQLCRGKKVDARLVGRTWYVNPISLEDHKRNRHQSHAAAPTQTPAENPTVKILPTDVSERVDTTQKPSRVNVPSPEPSVFRSQAFSQLAESPTITGRTERKLFASYEPDEELLMPVLQKVHTPQPKTVRVEAAGAKRVRVANKQAEAVFSPTPLPEIVLSGTLEITDYPKQGITKETEEAPAPRKVDSEKVVNESAKNTDIASKNKDISDKRVANKKPVKVLKVSEKGVKKETLTKPMAHGVKVSITQDTQVHGSKKAEITAEDRKKPVTAFERRLKNAQKTADTTSMTGVSDEKTDSAAKRESKVQTNRVSFAPESIQEQVEQPVSILVRVSPLIATILAVLCVAAVFSAGAVVVAQGDVYESAVILQFANLLEVLGR